MKMKKRKKYELKKTHKAHYEFPHGWAEYTLGMQTGPKRFEKS